MRSVMLSGVLSAIGFVFAGVLLVNAQGQVPLAAERACSFAGPEAPTGFDNKTNCFESQKDFDRDRKAFEDVETIVAEGEGEEKTKGGLGPVYNAPSCVTCHQNPVTGSSSQISEIRAGHRALRPVDSIPPQFVFVEPRGGSLIHQRAIDSRIQEHVLPGNEVRTLRMSNTILGNGFVEVIQDADIIDNCVKQPEGMRGLPILLPVAVGVDSVTGGKPKFKFVLRVGRFGWKNQEASLMNFSAGAYINEMGITNPLQLTENLSNGRDVSAFDPIRVEPEDKPVLKDGVKTPKSPDDFKNPFGEDVEKFARFMRSTKAPPRTFAARSEAFMADVDEGSRLFDAVQCAVCHKRQYKTPPVNESIKATFPASAPQAIDFNDGKVPTALADKNIHPFSDFLLHDVGTGDGIVQTQHAQLPAFGADEVVEAFKAATVNSLIADRIPDFCKPEVPKTLALPSAEELAIGVAGRTLDQRTANLLRTAPLWGLAVRPQLLHDGSALTIEEAILRHDGQALESKRLFIGLSYKEQQRLLAFLGTL
jgi:CxxC motif-containing protein (DUF1111 family)